MTTRLKYPAGLCALPSAASTTQAVGEERPQRSCGASVPLEAVKFGLRAPQGTVTSLLSVSGAGEMVGFHPASGDVHHWDLLVGVDRERGRS